MNWEISIEIWGSELMSLWKELYFCSDKNFTLWHSQFHNSTLDCSTHASAIMTTRNCTDKRNYVDSFCSTFVCPTEIVAFSDRIEDFRNIGCEVVGVSTDSHFSHLAWLNTPRKEGGLGGLKYPLLADKSMKIGRDYGVLLEDAGVTLRGLFIIDPKQTLRQITVNDLPVGRSVDETLRLVQAFQFTDEHGEVCPANWNPKTNNATMVPDPEKSKKYFNSAN